MAQHRISERLLAVARFVVVPVSDFQAALHFQPAAVGGVPLPEQMWEIAIENKMIGAAGVFDRDIDLALGGFERNLRGVERTRILFRIDRGPGGLDLDGISR